MRKVIFPLALVAAVLIGSNRLTADVLYYQLVLPTPNSWQIWVKDGDATGATNLGIDGFGCTLTASSGTIGLAINGTQNQWCTAPIDTADYLGYTIQLHGGSASSQVLIAQQGTRGVVPVDSTIFHVGQNAMADTGLAGNNNGLFVGDEDPWGDKVTAADSWSTTNLAGLVKFFTGTNSVAGAINANSISAPSGAVFTLDQPNDLKSTSFPFAPIKNSVNASTVTSYNPSPVRVTFVALPMASAEVVPLPPAVCTGLATLGGLAALGLVRRRQSSQAA